MGRLEKSLVKRFDLKLPSLTDENNIHTQPDMWNFYFCTFYMKIVSHLSNSFCCTDDRDESFPTEYSSSWIKENVT